MGQARIAEIESNPGAVSVDQLMKVISALRASLVLRDDALEVTSNRPDAAATPPTAPANKLRKQAKQPPVNTPPTGQWRMQPLTGGGQREAEPEPRAGREALAVGHGQSAPAEAALPHAGHVAVGGEAEPAPLGVPHAQLLHRRRRGVGLVLPAQGLLLTVGRGVLRW